MLELLTLDYAEALYDYGQTDEAVAVLETAINNYHGDWEARLEDKLNRYRGQHSGGGSQGCPGGQGKHARSWRLA